MRDLILGMSMSLDGFVAGPNGEGDWVFSTSSPDGKGRDARVASGPLADEIDRLKREDGKPIFAHGGAAFAQSLVGANLVDELRLAVHPIALGQGKPLFAKLEARSSLALVECTRFESGTVGLVYRRR